MLPPVAPAASSIGRSAALNRARSAAFNPQGDPQGASRRINLMNEQQPEEMACIARSNVQHKGTS